MDFHATPYRLIAHIRQDQASLALRKTASFLMRLLSAFALLHVWQVSRSCFGTVCSVLPKHDTWTTQRSAWYNLLTWECWTKQGHKDPPKTLLNWKPCWISPRWSKQVVRSLECIWTNVISNHFMMKICQWRKIHPRPALRHWFTVADPAQFRAVPHPLTSWHRDEGPHRAAKRKQQFQLRSLGSFEALGFVPEAFYYQNFHLWTIHVSCWFSIESSRSYLLRNLAQMSTQTLQVKSS